MRRFAIAAALGLALLGPAGALTSEAVNLRAGPLETGDTLSPVWMARCPGGQRLVGLRLHKDKRIAGIEAICVRLREDRGAVRWLSEPAVAPEPPKPPPPRMVTREVEREAQGTVLRADSMGVSRRRGSRAMIITITEPVQDEQPFPTPLPTVDFGEAPEAADLLCPNGQFVKGLRLGSERHKGITRVSALQLLCGDARGRTLATVGAWPAREAPVKATKKKGKKAKAVTPVELAIQRIECGGPTANPHDGTAASAVFGTEEDGIVETIGLSCARAADPMAGQRTIYASARRAVARLPRFFGWQQTYEKPLWFDGAQLAVCAPGVLDRGCAQDSADRYCREIESYDHAIAYTVGRFAKSSVAATGERCARGACRAFSTITCGFGEAG